MRKIIKSIIVLFVTASLIIFAAKSFAGSKKHKGKEKAKRPAHHGVQNKKD